VFETDPADVGGQADPEPAEDTDTDMGDEDSPDIDDQAEGD